MSDNEKTTISEFLKEREGRYKPDDPSIQNFRRLNKINFNGNIHLSDKASKTNMILIKPGDLVISGINVSKGAIAVYEGQKPIVATIHYSTYIFNEEKININFFKRFLKSQAFIEALKNQVKGGIKTEIKPKHLLPLKVKIPVSIKEQQKINNYFDSVENELEELNTEITKQKNHLKKIRQQILQDAIQGKLTKKWRKESPDIEPASELLKRIKAEKEKLIKESKIKKQKPLPPIKDEEIPFELPKGWVWCRLGDVIYEAPRNGFSPKAVDFETKVKTLKLSATTSGVFLDNQFKYINEKINKDSHLWLKSGDILIQRSNSIVYVGVSAIFLGNEKEFIYPDLMMKIKTSKKMSTNYLHKVLSSPFIRSYFKLKASGSQKSMPKVNQDIVKNALIPCPSFEEQKIIVSKVQKLTSYCDELEQQINESERRSELLMQSILKEAFENN